MDNQKIRARQTRRFFSRLIFCLVLLFNPNIFVIDILPDFIAFFMLAKLFEDASDVAPYFEEARVGFIRLGWLNLAKIPGLLIISAEMATNTYNDIFALVSFVFAVAEILLLLPAIKNIFEALFRLGERSDAEALIKSQNGYTTDSLRILTYLFAICKCICYSLPTAFLLTRTNDKGYGTQIVTISNLFPITFVLSLLFGLIVGIVWLVYMLKYTKTVRAENKFLDAIDAIAAFNEPRRENKRTLRKMKFATTMLFVSALFSFELSFSNYSEINILPHFIYACVFTYTLVKLIFGLAYKKTVIVLGSLYAIAAAVFYYFQTKFLLDYGYSALLRNPKAREAYLTVKLLSVVELVMLAALLIVGACAMRKFVYKHTGIPADSERYGRLEKEFHGAMMARIYAFFGAAFIAGAAKCANAFVNGALKIIFTNPSDVTQPTIIAPSLAWFGVVIVASAVIYAGVALYLSTVLKEELEAKYFTY